MITTVRSRIRNTAILLLDTEVLFAFGDCAAAFLTAEIIGVVLNCFAAALALGGRIYERLWKKNPLGLGFYGMAAVSAATAISTIASGIEHHGLSGMLNPETSAAREQLFSATAFTAWTLANCLAGYRRSVSGSTQGNGLFGDQAWFCIGSIAATHAKPLPLVFFVLGLGRTTTGRLNNDLTIRQQLLGYFTPQQLRGIAYAISMTIAIIGGSAYFIPYALWMLGNFVFESNPGSAQLTEDDKEILSPGSVFNESSSAVAAAGGRKNS